MLTQLPHNRHISDAAPAHFPYTVHQQLSWLMSQVSELSHKLGTVEGNCRSMEEELSRLQKQNVQLGKSKNEREVDANELRARLRSADEKVHISCCCRASQNNICKA